MTKEFKPDMSREACERGLAALREWRKRWDRMRAEMMAIGDRHQTREELERRER